MLFLILRIHSMINDDEDEHNDRDIHENADDDHQAYWFGIDDDDDDCDDSNDGWSCSKQQ